MTAWKTRAAVKEGNGGYWETTEWAREGEDEKSEKSESKDFLADDDGLLGRFGPGRGSVDTKEVRVGELVNVKLVLCKDQRGRDVGQFGGWQGRARQEEKEDEPSSI